MKQAKNNAKKLFCLFLALLLICGSLFAVSPMAFATGVYPDVKEDGSFSKESDYFNSHNAPVLYGTTGITVPLGTVIDYKWDARFRVFAKDNEDGDITKNITASDNINSAEAGTYHINYSVKDSNGNVSTLDVPVTILADFTDIVLEKTMYSLPSVDHLNSVGQTRGNNMDRQMIGIFVQAGASFELKKQSSGNMTVKLERNDSQQESQAVINKNNEWTTIKNVITSNGQELYYDVVPSIKTLYKEPGKVTYTVKWDSTDSRIKPLHYYHEGDGLDYQNQFMDEWAKDENSYAMIDGLSMMVLVPYQDHDHMFYVPYPGGKPYKSFDHFLTWWNDIMDEYDELIGLSYTPDQYWNQNVKTKYFVKANAHGAGAAYYNGSDHVGINSTSDWSMFQVGWGGLHEVGHGYQGNLNGSGGGMNLGEVGVNIGGYYIQDVAHKFIYNESWLNVPKNEATFNKARLAGLGYLDNGEGNIGAAAMLYSIVNALGYFEDFSQHEVHGYKQANAYINQYFRKHYFETNEKLPTADAWCLALAEKYNVNFVLYFESWGVKVSDYVKEQLMQSGAELVYYMRDLVGDDATAKSIKPDSNVGIYDLVTTSELHQLSPNPISADIEFEFKINDLSEIMGKSLYIADGSKIIKTIKLTDENVKDGVATVELPVGAYKVAVPKPNGVYDFDNLYVVVQKGTKNHYDIVYNPITDISFGNDVLIKSIGYWGASKVPFQIEVIGNQMKFSYQGTYTNSAAYSGSELFSSLTVYDTSGNMVYDKRVNGGMSAFVNVVTAEDKVDVAPGYKLTLYYRGNVNDVSFYSTLTGEKLNNYTISSSSHQRTYVVTEFGLIPEDILGDYPDNISDEVYEMYKERLNEYIEGYLDGKTQDELLDPFSPNKGSNVIKKALENLREEDVKDYEELLKSMSTGDSPVITSSEGLLSYEFDLADDIRRTIQDVYDMITVTDKEDGVIFANGTLTEEAKRLGADVTIESDVNWEQVGTYHVTITAIDSHDNISVLVLEVVIIDTDDDNLIDISDFTATVDSPENGFVYTGEAITPSVTVVDNDGHILTQGTDYELVYEDNINAGKATVTVVPIEHEKENGTNYTGSITITFDIKKAAPPVIPSNVFVVETDVDSTDDITLPEGWKWKNGDTALAFGENKFVLVYEGDENHEAMSLEVTVTRQSAQDIPEPPAEIPETDPDDDDIKSSGEPWGEDNPNHGGDFTDDPANDVGPNDDGNGEAKDPGNQGSNDDPETPTEPVDPEAPTEPVDPEEPTKPADPEETTKPADPEKPTKPGNTGNTEEPEESAIIADGTDEIYVIGSGQGASIHCSYPLNEFISVYLNGKFVDPANYTLTEGSTILTFKPEFLDTLAVGKYNVTLNFVSGSVTTVLTIKESAVDEPATNTQAPAEITTEATTADSAAPEKSPATGAASGTAIAFASIALAGAAVMLIKKKEQD